MSLKPPAQRPTWQGASFQQAGEKVCSLCVLLCLETPSKKQRMDLCMDLLSRNEMVMGGSPELFFPQPPTDAIHKEAAAPPICLLFQVSTCFGGWGTLSHTQVLSVSSENHLPLQGLPDPWVSPCSQSECRRREGSWGHSEAPKEYL